MTPICNSRSPRVHRVDLLLRRLLFELDLVAGQREVRFRRARARPRRQDLQPHHGVSRAADQLHDVVEPPADHVGHLAGFALADGRDAVVGLEPVEAAAEPPGMTFMTVT